jgi:hypothetical protein
MCHSTLSLAVVTVALFHTACAGMLAAAPRTQGKEPQVLEGVVLTASADQISIRAADGKEHSFKANEMTRVTVNGKPGKLTDIKVGMQVRVMVDQAGKVTSVSTVDDRKLPFLTPFTANLD